MSRSFSDLLLHRQLLLGLQQSELEEATEIQAAVIPAALKGKDLKISAETGSGKTLAYLLPIAHQLIETPPSRTAGTIALILVPTRELARQVVKEGRKLLAKTSLEIQAVTGGADFKYQRAMIRDNPEILVATPGRLREHYERGSLDLAALRTLVLDEADRMLDMGFRDDVLFIADFCPSEKQVLLLSATLKHKSLSEISGKILVTPETIAIGEVRQAHSSIFHQVILADSRDHKDRLLVALMQKGGFKRALVFSGKRITSDRLAGLLRHHDLRCDALHGDLSTEERKAVMARFGDGKIDIVCASDLAARGIDVPGIDLVVNYELPGKGDDYLHRTGRTGRAGAEGLAIAIVDASQWNLMISIQRYLKLEFERRTLPGLKARYQGPKKTKSSGKASGSKKKRRDKPDAKSKSRERNRKNQGKPRRDDNKPANDGFAPLMKPKKQDSDN